MKRKTLFVNLFSGPGSGKSTLAAGVFAKLKMLGVEVEVSWEYVKDLVWEESFKKIENQIYVFGKQQNRSFRLNGKVDIVITDSPFLNSIVYYYGDNPHFADTIMYEFKKLKTLNYFLNRSFDYVQNGRIQNLEKAKEIDIQYKDLLDSNDIKYTMINGGYDNVNKIVEDIINIIKK